MNIFIREMKAHIKSLMIWCIGVTFIIAEEFGEYASMSTNGQTMNEVMSKMPKPLKALIGIGSFDLSKASGYYGMLYLYILLMAAIHAAMLGAGIISKEERDKTAEFLMVKPVSRSRVITSKLMAALANIVILNVITFVTSIILVGHYGKGEEVGADIAVLMAGMFILQLIFMLIGTLIAAASKNPKTAVSVSTGILLITFILSIFIDINGKIDSLKYITPFKYFEAKNLMYGGGLSAVFVILSIAIIAALSASTYMLYSKRDLNI